jgi:hypothetical protein
MSRLLLFRHILSAYEAITCCMRIVAISVEVDGKERTAREV